MSYRDWTSGPSREDLQRFAVWLPVSEADQELSLEQAEEDGLDLEDIDDEDHPLYRDEATLRPRDGFAANRRPVSLDEASIIAVRLRFADGSEHVGFIDANAEPPDYDLTLVSDTAYVAFVPAAASRIAETLGRGEAGIFPATFETVVPVKAAGGDPRPIAGVIEP